MRDLCIAKVARWQKRDRRPLCASEFYKYELKLRTQNPRVTKWQCVLHIFVLPCSRGPLHGNPTIPCHASHPILSHGSHGCLLQVLCFLVLSEKKVLSNQTPFIMLYQSISMTLNVCAFQVAAHDSATSKLLAAHPLSVGPPSLEGSTTLAVEEDEGCC